MRFDPDISADDVLRAIVGMIYAQGGGDWQAMALRLVDVFVDGLRVHKMSRRDLSHAERPAWRLVKAEGRPSALTGLDRCRSSRARPGNYFYEKGVQPRSSLLAAENWTASR